jgi:iron-sulfur cluster assembly protein
MSIQETTTGVTLSETAAKEIKSIITEQDLPADKTRLRVGVKGGGCSGFSYMLDLVEEEPGEQDEQFDSNGVKIVIDMKSHLYLNGTEIDFRDEVMGKGFVFKNPNATSTCGCGHSFSACVELPAQSERADA